MVFQGLTCLTGSRGQAVMLGLFRYLKQGLGCFFGVDDSG